MRPTRIGLITGAALALLAVAPALAQTPPPYPRIAPLTVSSPMGTLPPARSTMAPTISPSTAPTATVGPTPGTIGLPTAPPPRVPAQPSYAPVPTMAPYQPMR